MEDPPQRKYPDIGMVRGGSKLCSFYVGNLDHYVVVLLLFVVQSQAIKMAQMRFPFGAVRVVRWIFSDVYPQFKNINL